MVVEARLAKYLREERKELKLSSLAEKSGISKTRFSMILNCHQAMRVDELERVCEVLGVSPEMFIKPNTNE